MHHMDCFIEIKDDLCTRGKVSIFLKVTTFGILPVFHVGMAV